MQPDLADGTSRPHGTFRVVAAGLSVTTTSVAPVFLAGALAVQMAAEFGYGTRGIGVTMAAFYAAATAGSVSLGRLADRIGWPHSILLGGAGCVIGLAALGLLSRSLFTVLLLLIFAGLTNALAQPAVNLFLARRGPGARRGVIFGLKQSAIPLATLLGGLSVPAIALRVGWRWVFLIAAGLGVIALLAVPRAAKGRQGTGVAVATPVSGSSLRHRGLSDLMLVTLLGQTGASVLGSFVVVSAVDIGMEEGAAGLLLAVASVICIGMRVTLGWAADRGLSNDIWVITSLLAAGAGAMALLAIPVQAAAVVGAVLAYAAGWGWPGLMNLIVVRRFEDAPATATSVTQLGVYVGSALGPLMFGLIASASFAAAWLTSAAFLAAAALVAARHQSRSKRAGRRPDS